MSAPDHSGPGLVVELRVGPTMAVGGDAIGRLPDGRVVFVEGALPGERVEVGITEQHRDYARGRLRTLVEASSERVDPPCPWVARGCGGCGWQHASPVSQLVMKESVVLDALRRLAHLDAAGLMGPGTAASFEGYRTTVHLGVDPSGRPSYRRRHTGDLVAVRGCRVVHPRLDELIDQVRLPGTPAVTLRVGVAGGERLVIPERPGISRRGGARGRRGGPGRLRGLDAGDDACPGGAAAGAPDPEGGKLGRRADDAVVPPDAVVVGPDADGTLTEEVGGRRWQVSARSFFQAGPQAAEILAALAAERIGPLAAGDHLVDLYAGVGVLGGVISAHHPGVALTAVEADRSAVLDARHNLADLDAVVAEAEVGAWSATPATAVIADPARPGLGRPGVAAVAATGCRRLVLVSCDPASLARDVSLLAAAGYRLRGVRVVDLFAHTPHVETVSWFDQVGAGP